MGVDSVAKKMSEASAGAQTSPPKKGEQYQCSVCGMAIQVTADCQCNDKKQENHAHFHCCGEKMTKV
jgi:hypothetical protein